MNLASMRTKFSEYTSGLTSQFTDAERDEYLNRAYQYFIPADVGGEWSELHWELRLTIGQVAYPYAAHIIGINSEAASISSYYTTGTDTVNNQGLHYLDVESDPITFEREDQSLPEGATTGLPNACLFYQRQVKVSPAPDKEYILKIPVRGGPSAGLTTAGIENEIHAQAVIHSAAAEYLTSAEDADGFSREFAAYGRYRDRLMVYAQSRPNQRRRKRSF